MQKITKFKKFFVILLSVVMFTSPILFSGCEYSNTTTNKKNPLDFETRYGDSIGSGADNTDPNQPDPANQLVFQDYFDYFKNYRLTYKPGDVDRESFDNSIIAQNNSIAESIILELNKNYGTKSTINKPLLNEQIQDISALNGEQIFYIKDDNGDPFYYKIGQTLDNIKYFTHENAAQSFLSTENNENKLKLAEVLILSGNYINSEETEKNTFDAIYNTYNSMSGFFSNPIMVNVAINEYVSQIDHLGYTKEEIDQLSTFVLNYIIGTEKVAEDNNRFVNAYCDINGFVQILYYGASTNSNQKNENYNRFLTDETYATGIVSNGELIFTIPDEEGNPGYDNLEGLLYYSGEYLKKASLIKSFDYNTVEVLGSTSALGFDHPSNVGANTDDINISQPVFNKLIATDYRDGFNGNVWGRADKNGVVQNYVEYDVGVNNYSYAVFSVRLPYFKNYYNTVHFMVEDLLWQEVTDENRAQLDAQWRVNHPDMESYPYKEVFPIVPLTYFADYDNGDMLFDGLDVTHMFSGYQAYQSMVIMPQKDVYVEEVSLWFVRQLLLSELVDGKVNGSGDFELSVYARYFDYESQSYATWGDGEEETEFYFIDTLNVTFNPVYDNFGEIQSTVPSYLQISTKDILNSAKINGTERNSYLLNAFPEGEKVLTHQTNLLSKDNYGWWFKQYSTPQGDTVVCFDGKNMATQSYLEFVISNKTNSRFQFCICPDICYHK